MESKTAVQALAALAQDSRLAVYRLLVEIPVHEKPPFRSM